MQKRLFTLFAILVISAPLFAQRSSRVNYISLINRASAPQIFIDDLILPTKDGKVDLALIFRFDNDFLPFKKISPSSELNAPSGMEFYTITRLNSEIFKGKIEKKNNLVETETRDFWIDTLFTKTFEETESKNLYASGSLSNTLSPGDYNYVLQLSLMENTNERTSSKQNIKIWDWEKKPTGEIILIKEKLENNNLLLTNMADNVLFGKDFMALIRIPKYSTSENYTVNISMANINPKDTTKTKLIYSSDISSNQIKNGVIPEITGGENPALTLIETEMDFTYALVPIPNSTFENSAYVLEVTNSNSKKPIAKKVFRSYWPDMPASLLNLNIAIDNLKFIVNEEKIKELKEGNEKDKEKKFRDFWNSKDPTPNTVYNELMAEYYRRIDYAFVEFRNPGNPLGFESDQGEIYIKFGPPNSIDRQFPNNGKVIEIWKYNGRKFVFESSSGFGDFVLLTTE